MVFEFANLGFGAPNAIDPSTLGDDSTGNRSGNGP